MAASYPGRATNAPRATARAGRAKGPVKHLIRPTPSADNFDLNIRRILRGGHGYRIMAIGAAGAPHSRAATHLDGFIRWPAKTILPGTAWPWAVC
jgi:hypothetical protein